MKESDTAYISALMDSIGAIKIESPKKGEECCLYVWITHKDFKLMEYLQRSGAFIIHLDDKQFRAKWKDHGAYKLLKSIIPFSKMRREQVRVGIEFFEAKTSETKQENFSIPFLLRLKMLKAEE
jgi:hypothetical protein